MSSPQEAFQAGPLFQVELEHRLEPVEWRSATNDSAPIRTVRKRKHSEITAAPRLGGAFTIQVYLQRHSKQAQLTKFLGLSGIRFGLAAKTSTHRTAEPIMSASSMHRCQWICRQSGITTIFRMHRSSGAGALGSSTPMSYFSPHCALRTRRRNVCCGESTSGGLCAVQTR